MKAAELCAGYGGLALAVEEVFGAKTAWLSEFEDAPSRILAHHWPGVPNHGDMTKIDWASVEPVDIISGGTPCQDLSHAGARRGMAEGTRSNLWVQMREAIATIKPTYVVWENVRGAYSAGANSDVEPCPGCVGETGDGRHLLRALGRVLGDLSDLGYDCQWRGLRAADVGAPHGRFRVFVLATLRDAEVRGRAAAQSTRQLGDQERERPGSVGGSDSTAADTIRGGQSGWSREARGEEGCGAPAQGTTQKDSPAILWGEYGPAIHRWGSIMGRPAPSPVEAHKPGAIRANASFLEWMMGVPEGWICSVPGVTWNEAIKAAGNGVVPQQAIAALRDMLR